MSTPPSTSNVPALHQGEHPLEHAAEKSLLPITVTVNKETSDVDVLWVDWDGPKDPMNPKKSAI